MFFTFDGIDGTGKSLQKERFCQWLQSLGHEVTACRDPGSSQLGEALREIILHRDSIPLCNRSEMLLYMAARAQLVDEVIRPAIDAGRIVVSDRFLLANVVYQAHAGELPVEDAWAVGRVAVDGVEPDLTFLLDMDVVAAAARIDRGLDRLEQRGVEYLDRVRKGFLLEARQQPDRIIIINADQSIEAVQRDILTAAQRLLD